MATKFSETEDAEASATVLAKVNICSICGISCARKQNLRKHIESWHKTVNVDDVCPVKRAKRIDFEKESERRSTGELGSTKSAITSKANACPICGVSCATVSSVRRHIKFCHKDVNVDDVCIRKRNKKVIDLCEKVGSIASTVTVAAKRCSICDALCSTSANVCQQIQTHEHASQEHKDTNVDEVCPVKRRTRITTSSHVCVTCCKAFSRRSSLLRHIRFLHTDFDSGVFTAKKRSQVRCPGM